MVNAALRQKPSEPHYQREISSLFRCSPSANELVYVRVVRVVPLTDDYNTRTGNRKLTCNFSGDSSVSSYREENRRKSRAASSRQNRKTVSQSLSSDRRFCSKLFASWEDPMEWLSAVRAVPRVGSQQSDGMNNNDSQERVHFIISNGILIETVFHFPVHLTDHQIEALSDGMYSMLYCDIQSRVSRSKLSYRRATDILTDLAHCRVGLSPDRCQSLGMHHDALGLTVHLDEWDTRVTPLSIVYFHIQHVPVRTSIPSSHAVTRTSMHNPRALRQQRKGIEVTQDFHTTHEKKDWSSTSGAEAQNFCTAQSEHYVGSTPLAEEITCTIKKQDVTFMNAFQFINKQFNTLHALLDDHRTRIIAELQASHKVQRCEILNGSAHTAFDVQMDMTAVVRALRQCLNLKINVNGQSLTVLWKDCTSQVAALRAMEEAQETDPALNQPDPVNLELFTLQLQKKYPRLAFVTDQSVTHSCMILFYMEDDADSKAFAENEADIYLRKRELHSENAFSYPTESNSACAQSQNCDSTGVDRGSAGVANEPHFRVAFVAFRKNVHIYLEEEDDMNTIIHGFPTRRFHVQGPFLHATMLEKPLHWLTADLCTEVSGGRFSF